MAWWWMLVACGGDLGLGALACLELPEETGGEAVVVDGEVVEVGEAAADDGDACAWNVAVADADGTVWRAGFTVVDDAGEDRTPRVGLDPGDAVRLAFVDEPGMVPVRRLVVRRDGALVVAAGVSEAEVEEGGGVGVGLDRDVVTATRHVTVTCEIAAHPLVFTSRHGARVSVAPYGVGDLPAPGDGDFDVYALSGFGTWDPEGDCRVADLGGPAEWVVVRRREVMYAR